MNKLSLIIAIIIMMIIVIIIGFNYNIIIITEHFYWINDNKGLWLTPKEKQGNIITLIKFQNQIKISISLLNH